MSERGRAGDASPDREGVRGSECEFVRSVVLSRTRALVVVVVRSSSDEAGWCC
jgi:hypothetical protein